MTSSKLLRFRPDSFHFHSHFLLELFPEAEKTKKMPVAKEGVTKAQAWQEDGHHAGGWQHPG